MVVLFSFLRNSHTVFLVLFLRSVKLVMTGVQSWGWGLTLGSEVKGRKMDHRNTAEAPVRGSAT